MNGELFSHLQIYSVLWATDPTDPTRPTRPDPTRPDPTRVGVGSNGVGSDRLWGEGRCWVELGSLRVGRVGGGPLRVGRVGCSCDPIFQQALAQGRFKYMSDHPQTMDT